MRPQYLWTANWQAIGYMWPRHIFNVVLTVFKIKTLHKKNLEASAFIETLECFRAEEATISYSPVGAAPFIVVYRFQRPQPYSLSPTCLPWGSLYSLILPIRPAHIGNADIGFFLKAKSLDRSNF